ncbi:MAG TPA: hypothetical protein VMV49_07120 [Candidatus Deferrimicrobium sp.]|nr:hypothetical protein [Candidatus Deferrimicrobium sp.]
MARSTVLGRHTVLDRGPRQPEIGRWSSLRRMARGSGILRGAARITIVAKMWQWMPVAPPTVLEELRVLGRMTKI